MFNSASDAELYELLTGLGKWQMFGCRLYSSGRSDGSNQRQAKQRMGRKNMRVMNKKKALRLLDTMQSMHRVIAAADMQCMSGYVEDCCQAAAAIDETVKKKYKQYGENSRG